MLFHCYVILGSNVTEEDSDKMEDLFRRVGIIEEVEEAHVNAVTGLGGSGPAYVSDLSLS